MHKIFTVDYTGNSKDGTSSERVANVIARSAQAAKAALTRKMKWHFETISIGRVKVTPIDLVVDN
jgi:hypothetical protein